MHSFQTFLKSTREAKELQRETVADAINLSVQTIEIIEEADNDSLLQNSSSVLKNQVRRYCEYLEISEKKIVSILNKIDVLHYKKSRYGKLKLFDYINRFAILILAVVIMVLVIKHLKEDVYVSVSEESPKSAIIYTPINYDLNEPDQQQQTVEHKPVADISATQNVSSSNNGVDSGSSEVTKAGNDSPDATINQRAMKAHPPATANMNNIVIDDGIDDTTK